ncbi:MAG: M4 family metallopeptidase, partial [Holophagae bacterium]|nr:M4 family metallopeptidase [Holophagae bacterium]
MAEMLNEPGDVDWIMGTGSSETRSFIHPNCSTYKWFSVAEYYNYGGCPHKNHGPIERAAYLLAEGGPGTIQGISFESIGLSDTAELYWDVLVASVLDQNFEETAQLARTLAADIWGSSSNQHTQVSNVMDAMDIWRTPSTVSYSVGRMLYFPISRFAPAAVNWSRWVWPALYIEHWLFYSAGTSETTPTDICWVKGLWENWHSSACAGLSSKYKTLLPVDAVVFDDKIWVFFHPAFSFSVQYFTIDKSLNVSSPVNTGRVSAGYPRVTTDGSGIIMSFLNVKNTPYLSYYTNGTWTNFSVPITVIPGITPTPVYDEDTDSLWLLSVGADEKTYVKKADWQCVLSSGSNCWANSGSVPKGSSSNFDVIAAGSPAGAMWGNELYVSQVITGPPSGTAVVYVDSCFNHAYSDCNS